MSNTNFYALTDEAILHELGERITAQRLRKNISQEEIAHAIGVSRMAYNRLESGKGKLSTLVAALRYLECLESLDSFVPAPQFSPVAARKLKGQEKARASKRRKTHSDTEQAGW